MSRWRVTLLIELLRLTRFSFCWYLNFLQWSSGYSGWIGTESSVKFLYSLQLTLFPGFYLNILCNPLSRISDLFHFVDENYSCLCWILDTCCTGFEWNKHRCTYVHFVEFILVDVVTLLYKDEVIWNGNHSSLYTNATIDTDCNLTLVRSSMTSRSRPRTSGICRSPVLLD